MHRLIFTILLTAIAANTALADKRNFVWTYQWMTMERGEAEFEQYTTFETLDSDDFENTTGTGLDFELEIGMTDRFDIGIYQSFSQAAETGLSYSGFKIRARYRIGEQDEYFLDPLIYLEYKGKPGFSEHTIEPKFILAKRFGDFELALNPYFEYEYEDGHWEFEPKYAAGFCWQLTRRETIGFEFKGAESGHYFGPTITHGLEGLWVGLGALFGIADVESNKPDNMIRMIIGVGL